MPFLDPEILARIARLGFYSRKLVEGSVSGLHRSPLHGLSVEFADYREYAPGDDLKRIDWRAYARSNKFQIKRYEEESNLRATIVFDASASMGYGRRGLTKFQYAATLAACLAGLLIKQRDAVGLAVFDEQERSWLRPASTHAQLNKILDTLETTKPDRKTELSAVMRKVAGQIKSRGLIVVISDLLTDLESFYDGLGRLQHQGNEILIFQVLDADEIELPFNNSVLFRDIEGTEELFAEPWAFRKAYEAAMTAFVEDVRGRCHAAGIDHLLLTTDSDLSDALSHYLHGRQGGRPAGNADAGEKAGNPRDILLPLMLTGLVIAGVPTIIHLLNRRRFIVVDWAPMKYLKLTIRTNRRRVQIEQLLLLALRTLLMILIVLVIARPALSKAGIGRWLAKRARVSRVVVLDDSLSMGYRTDNQSALDRGKAAVAEVLRNTGSQDAVTVMTTTPGAGPLVKEASLADPAKTIALVRAVRQTDAAANWAGAFKSIDDCLSTATFPQKQLVLVTDLRRTGWTKDVTATADKWAAAGVECRIVDVGSRSTTNVALLKFSQDDPVAIPAVPTKLTATIRNDTLVPLAGATATLTVDGQTRPVMLPAVAAGATVDVPLSITPDKPGQHVVRLVIPDDALIGDNARTLILDARDRVDVTLVDGREGAGPFESAGDFLQVVFGVGIVPWHVSKIGDTDPQANHPVAADETVVVDAAGISPAAAAGYEKLVADGMGLIIFVGDQVDPQAYNDRLYKDGNGLLPARLESVVDEPAKGLVVENYGDSPLAPLARLTPAALSRVTTRKLMGVESPAKWPETVRVLARWNDPENHPAVIEKRFGRGRVILFTTSADLEWTDWPKDLTYPLAVQSAAVAAARPDSADDNVVTGHTIDIRPGDGQPFTNPRITPPDETQSQPLPPGPTIRDGRTEFAGVYSATWTDAAGKDQHRQIAAAPDRSASDLEPIPPDQLIRLLGGLKPEVVPYVPAQLAAAGGGREIWRHLAVCLLSLMVVESVFAFYVGREK